MMKVYSNIEFYIEAPLIRLMAIVVGFKDDYVLVAIYSNDVVIPTQTQFTIDKMEEIKLGKHLTAKKEFLETHFPNKTIVEIEARLQDNLFYLETISHL